MTIQRISVLMLLHSVYSAGYMTKPMTRNQKYCEEKHGTEWTKKLFRCRDFRQTPGEYRGPNGKQTAADRPGQDGDIKHTCAGDPSSVPDRKVWEKMVREPTAPTEYKAGSIIDVEWKVTGNHGGRYSYRLCPQNTENTPTPHEGCFLVHVLEVVSSRYSGELKGTQPGWNTWSPMIPGQQWTGDSGYEGKKITFHDKVQLPAGVTCDQCTLSLRWDTKVESSILINCADIKISRDGPGRNRIRNLWRRFTRRAANAKQAILEGLDRSKKCPKNHPGIQTNCDASLIGLKCSHTMMDRNEGFHYCMTIQCAPWGQWIERGSKKGQCDGDFIGDKIFSYQKFAERGCATLLYEVDIPGPYQVDDRCKKIDAQDFGSFKISKVPSGGGISNNVKTPGWLNIYQSAHCTGRSRSLSLNLLHDQKYIRGDRCFNDSKMIVKSSFEVPVCGRRVLRVVMSMLSPECRDVLVAAVRGESNNAEMSCGECACYTEITPQGFLEATGVSADSCGAGSGHSFLDDLNKCRRHMEHCDDRYYHGSPEATLYQFPEATPEATQEETQEATQEETQEASLY